ncbi:MAG: RNA polymerase sigma-70 factor [Tannerella sp.]|jgi:RNA polymerase sigma-70 factor (ECF subfamily)|nr:RNA polymerase sigma-70 factor [Tannerella sp.]
MLSNKESNSFNFNDFYSIWYRKAFLFAKSYVHDKWAAEDIASEALTCLWKDMRDYEVRHPLTYLFSIVKHKSIDFLRHQLTQEEALAVMTEVGVRELNTRIATLEACDPERIYQEDVKEIVKNTLKALPERTRQVLMMSRFEYLTKEEIATALGITSKGVEYHISKALKSLRINLKDYLPLFCF